MTDKQLTDQIVEIRQKKGISQEELAKRLNMGRGNLSRIENNQFSVGHRKLVEIANALDMEIRFVDKQ